MANSLMSLTLILAALFMLIACARRLQIFNALPRPIDRAAPIGSLRRGIWYAFTIGMLPWSKESTRRHWIAYTRGVIFHLSIFLGLALLIISPWLDRFPIELRISLAALTAIGAVFGLIGFAARFIDHTLKAISTRDDVFAVLLVSAFLIALTLTLIDLTLINGLYLTAALLFIYLPLGKIRHCLYYAYARLFFGKSIGSRGVLHTKGEAHS